MQVYLKVPVIVKVMKGQSHGQGRAIKRQLSGVNSSKVRAKSNTGGSKEAPGDCNAPFSSNSILIFLRNANMPMMIKSMVQKYLQPGGFDGTSNVLAGKLFGIPVRGTHAHAFVTSFTGLEELSTRYIQYISIYTIYYIYYIYTIYYYIANTRFVG